ncbi:hypothetical protein LEL_07055 [Akanthomyces lecanii RCEF 1005]|uniref:Uncharacterized protein n=1 Tax=Akanthomyces lecanii RCEF 1005 TaxID=1081108 RepID=A0A168FEC9_CORDF|nr:hypothetical protein LEL_07055 [Akanthomyces lecanii RCEF 1005]
MAELSVLNVQVWTDVAFEQHSSDDDAEPGLVTEVLLVPDKLKEKQLGGSRYANTVKKDLHEPRSLVAAYDSRHFYFHVHFSQATYGRYRSQPACLVVLSLSFQKKGRSFSRFQAADIDVEFRDAPLARRAGHDNTTGGEEKTSGSGADSDSDSEAADDDDNLEPTVLDFEPRLFYGPVDVERGSAHATVKLGLTPSGSLTELGFEVGRKFYFPEEGFFKAHGTLRDNPPSRVRLCLSENSLRRNGIREEVSVALIIGYVPGGPIYFMMASKSAAVRTVPGVHGDLDNDNLLQKLTRLGQYGGMFIREMDP